MLSSIVWESINRWPLAAVAEAVLTASVIFLYPSQTRGAGVLRGVPPLLRWMGVTALAVSLLKPVVQRPKTAEQWGAILILVDCSRSMSVVDRGRPPGARVALAGALNRIPPGLRADVAASLAGDLDRLESRHREVVGAQSDLEYARVAGRGSAEKKSALREAIARYAEVAQRLASRATAVSDAGSLRQRLTELANVPAADARDAWVDDVARAIDRVQAAVRKSQFDADEQLYQSNPTVRAACDAVSKFDRLRLAEEALLHPGSGLVQRLGRQGPLTGVAIGRDLKAFNLTEGGRLVGPTALAAGENASDIAGAVTAAVNNSGGQPVRAVVLLSDGRQVGGRGDVTSALRPSGVPVFAVGVAPERTPDASISEVDIPTRMAFAGELLEGDVEVTDDALTKPPVEVRVTSTSSEQVYKLEPRSRRDRSPRGTVLSAHFTVPVNPRDARAAERLVFSVSPSPEEVTDENNRVERWIKVTSDRLRVALCTAAPTWDFEYLRNALSRRPWVVLDPHVLDPEHPALRMTPQQILEQDVLVLSDVPVNGLDVNQWDAVHTLVTARGGSVILVAGTSFPVADYVGQPLARTLLPFHDLRPSWREWPGEKPAFHFIATPLGEQEALRLADGIGGGPRRWQELPGLYRYLQVPDKNLYPDVQRLLLEADGGGAVLTERRLGAGRVFFLGLNETWRWRVNAAGQGSDGFWRQLVRHAAGEPYAVTSGPFSLDLDRVASQPGETVRIRARIRGAKSPAERAAVVPIRILRGNKVLSIRQLEANGAGRFAGQIGDLPEGDYEFELAGTAADGSAAAVRVPLHVAETDEAEMRDVSGDPSLLMRIARASGGQYLPIEQIDQLPDRINSIRETESQYARQPVWNSPYLFAFVLACFAGEWALRKRLGLA